MLFLRKLEYLIYFWVVLVFFFQAEDGIRDKLVTGVQTCALPICRRCCCRAACAPSHRPRPASARPGRAGGWRGNCAAAARGAAARWDPAFLPRRRSSDRKSVV